MDWWQIGRGFAQAVGWGIQLSVPIFALLAFLFREKIKQYFARSVALELEHERAALARDLKDYSASLERDMETYKVGLIAQAERLKAEQQIKTAVAMRLAEKKYVAIHDLLDHYADVPKNLYFFLAGKNGGNTKEKFIDRRRHQVEVIQSCHAILTRHKPFISSSLAKKTLALNNALVGMYKARAKFEDPAVTEKSDEYAVLSKAFREFKQAIDKEVARFEL